MDTETFWRLIETARGTVGHTVTADYDKRMAAALKAELVRLPTDEIMAFDNRQSELYGAKYGPDMEAAAHLISNIFFDGWHGPRYYCFLIGVMHLGRETFERAIQAPDSLAEHPAIQAIPAGNLPRIALLATENYNVAGAAYCQVEGGTLNDYLGLLWGEDADAEQEDEDEDDDDGHDEDADEEDSYYSDRYDPRWKKRLPRLLRLFGRPGDVNQTWDSDKPLKADGSPTPRPASGRATRNEPTSQTEDLSKAVLGRERGGWWRTWWKS